WTRPLHNWRSGSICGPRHIHVLCCVNFPDFGDKTSPMTKNTQDRGRLIMAMLQ
ncbi:hypothetical protein NDU88_001188, partial [Pleurodeles waltl]